VVRFLTAEALAKVVSRIPVTLLSGRISFAEKARR
jgi:hypothetical protein